MNAALIEVPDLFEQDAEPRRVKALMTTMSPYMSHPVDLWHCINRTTAFPRSLMALGCCNSTFKAKYV